MGPPAHAPATAPARAGTAAEVGSSEARWSAQAERVQIVVVEIAFQAVVGSAPAGHALAYTPFARGTVGAWKAAPAGGVACFRYTPSGRSGASSCVEHEILSSTRF